MHETNAEISEAHLSVCTQTIQAADGGACALTTVRNAQHTPAAPVVLLPGMFTGRRFWLSDKGIGLAAYLAHRGHPTYIVQRRGLSDSPPTAARAGMLEHVQYDLPAVQSLVSQQHDEAAFWGGHSFGGIMAARAGAQTLDSARIGGWILFATQFEVRKYMLDWPGNLLTRGISRVYGGLPSQAARLGPEDEPLAAIQDATNWVAKGRRETTLRDELNRLTQPVLAISGAGDTVDPGRGCRRFISHFASRDRKFVSAGRTTGYSEDFSHPGIVISKTAQREIWPLLPAWIAVHSQTKGAGDATAAVPADESS